MIHFKLSAFKQCAVCLTVLLLLGNMTPGTGWAQTRGNREFYQLKIYHLNAESQVKGILSYLKNAYLPALHRHGIPKVGVFVPVDQDTLTDKKIYVFIPVQHLEQLVALPHVLGRDKQYMQASADYRNAPYDHPAYQRIESILLHAFPMAPHAMTPDLQSPKSDRIYELRSYESTSESYNANKVEMFNKGGEIGIFKRIHANAVFYSNVFSGSHMPNLMYMTSYENMDDRNAHWKSFSNDPLWKKISSMDHYQHNVSHVDDIFLHGVSFSDL